MLCVYMWNVNAVSSRIVETKLNNLHSRVTTVCKKFTCLIINVTKIFSNDVKVTQFFFNNFEKVGVKKTMANFAPLTKITEE